MTKPKTKRAQLISRKTGASVDVMQAQLKWQPHTIRAEISRLRKGGLAVTCSTSPKGPVYHVQPLEQA